MFPEQCDTQSKLFILFLCVWNSFSFLLMNFRLIGSPCDLVFFVYQCGKWIVTNYLLYALKPKSSYNFPPHTIFSAAFDKDTNTSKINFPTISF